MRYNEHYGSAYYFEVGYLGALRTVRQLLTASADLEAVREFIDEMIIAQKEEIKEKRREQLPKED